MDSVGYCWLNRPIVKGWAALLPVLILLCIFTIIIIIINVVVVIVII